MKQATERRIAVHDQVTLVHEKTDLVVGQLAGTVFICVSFGLVLQPTSLTRLKCMIDKCLKVSFLQCLMLG
jgi:hypothetical protein